MAKIVLSPDAPENQPLAADFGVVSFDAGKATSFETDDAQLLAEVQRHPFFEVEGGSNTVSKEDGEAYLASESRLTEARQAYDELLPTLQPWDDQPVKPRTLADLEETDDADAKTVPAPPAPPEPPTTAPAAIDGGRN